jgi:hypothetical protein
MAADPFWAEVADAVQHRMRLVLSIRSDESPGLCSFQFLPPVVFEVEPLTHGAAAEKMEWLVDNGFVANPEHGWQTLRNRLQHRI